MIAGHFGFAALVKSRERQAPLWALMLATVWLDIVFVPLFPGHDLHQPRFGFGLWRHPWTAAGMELLLVVMGAWLYWRAARAITLEDDRARRRARLVSLLILIGGIVVLGLDFSGIG